MDSTPAAMTEPDNLRLARTVAAELPRLRAFVRRRVADLADVEDIVQDTLAELVAAEHLVQPIEEVARWLSRVARNRIIDRFRARARSPLTHRVALDEHDAPDGVIDEWLATAEGDPEAAYLRAALAAELEEAIAALPPAQRAVFLAHELEGRSFRELAAATGVPVNTLLGRKHDAVQALRRRLKEIRDDWND